MGNHLENLARYCDCLQIPWQINKVKPQQNYESKQDLKTEQQNFPNRSELMSNIFEDKNITMIQEREINSKFKNFQKEEEQIPSYRISDFEKELKENQEQMEIIDLEKIQPIILKQGYDKSRKIKTFYTTSKNENLFIRNEKNEEESGETLSNVFESENLQYFLGREDQAQFFDGKKAHAQD